MYMNYIVDIKFYAWKCLPSSSFDVLRVLAGRGGGGVNSNNVLAQTCAGWYFYSLQTFFL